MVDFQASSFSSKAAFNITKAYRLFQVQDELKTVKCSSAWIRNVQQLQNDPQLQDIISY